MNISGMSQSHPFTNAISDRVHSRIRENISGSQGGERLSQLADKLGLSPEQGQQLKDDIKARLGELMSGGSQFSFPDIMQSVQQAMADNGVDMEKARSFFGQESAYNAKGEMLSRLQQGGGGAGGMLMSMFEDGSETLIDLLA